MRQESLQIAIVGSGSWATAIIKMLCELPHTINWYVRKLETKQYIQDNDHNPSYLKSVELHTQQLNMSTDINDTVRDADVVIFAIPSVYLSSELDKMTVSITDKLVFSAVKGIIPETGLIVGDHLHQTYQVPYDQIGVITGPCHAEEVALERLSYITIGCYQKKNAKKLAERLTSDFIKVKISKDVLGLEYASMLKNIYAIASGVCHGLGYGDNFQSVIMSNAIREMKRFIKYLNKDTKRNINNSAYLGDLLVTGYSVFSRNRMFGNMIGKGYRVKSAMMEMTMVAEGYYATKSAYDLSVGQSDRFPIIHSMYQILYENQPVKQIVRLMTDKID